VNVFLGMRWELGVWECKIPGAVTNFLWFMRGGFLYLALDYGYGLSVRFTEFGWLSAGVCSVCGAVLYV
jgi:hypothetical protein